MLIYGAWVSEAALKPSTYDADLKRICLGITMIEMAKGEPPYAELHPMKVIVQRHRKSAELT